MKEKHVGYFKNHELVDSFTDAEFSNLIDLLEVKRFAGGEIVLEEGSENDVFYFLLDGVVEVLKYDTNSHDYLLIHTFHPGGMFGEMSIIAKEPISATIRAQTDCELITLSHHDALPHSFYIKLLLNSSKITVNRLRESSSKQAAALSEKIKEQTLREKLVGYFKNHELIDSFTNAEFSNLTDLLEVKQFTGGEIVLEEGSDNDVFYFLLDGVVEVLKYYVDSKDYFQIHTIHPGGMFGEMSIIAKEPISATIRAQTDCELITLSHHEALPHSFYVKLLLNSSKITVNRLRESSSKQAAALSEKIKEQTMREKLETELRAAHDVQTAFLPKSNPVIEGFEICGFSKAAKEVGGDFYDFAPVSEDKLAFCLGDVCGKGMPAALLMVDCRTILRSNTLHREDPQVDQICSQSNMILCDDTEGKSFVTCFLGILDKSDSSIQYCNAGHSYPLIYRRETDSFEAIAATGIMLGMFEETPFGKKSFVLNKGDMLIVYSDGVTEAHNVDKELYDMERLQNTIRQNAEMPAEQLQTTIIDSVVQFVGEAEQYDDITIVIIKNTG